MKRHPFPALLCLGCIVTVAPCHGEDTAAALLTDGHQKVREGKLAASVFQEAIRRDAALPKQWALMQKDDVSYARILSEMALAYQLERKLKESRALLQAAIEAKPSDLGLQLQLGDLHWQAQNFGLALAVFEKALEMDPKSAAAWHGKARCLQNTAEPDGALKAYEKATDLDPDNPKYLRDLGRLVCLRGETSRALKIYQRVADLSPEDTSIRCDIGWIHYRRGEYAEALKVFLRETKKDAADAGCWWGLGTVMTRLGRLKEAVHPLTVASQKDPAAPGIWRDLGTLHYTLGNHQEAAEAYRGALGLAMDHPVLWHHLGECLKALGKYEEALAAYRTASSLDSTGDAAGDQMQVLILMKQYEKAAETGKKALALGLFDLKTNPKGLSNPRYVYRELAEAYNGLKRYEDAIRACEEADRTSRHTGDGVYHHSYLQKGDAYVGLGEPREAEKAYQKAMRGPEPEIAKERLRRLEAMQEEPEEKPE